MEPEAKYTLVGGVLLLLIALLAGALIWLKSTQGERDDVPYKIYFSKHSLEGLQIRSDVKMQGIRVGSVTGFRLSQRRPGSVEVLIRVDDAARAAADLRYGIAGGRSDSSYPGSRQAKHRCCQNCPAANDRHREKHRSTP